MSKDKYQLKIINAHINQEKIKSSIKRILNEVPIIAFSTVDRKTGEPHISNTYYGYTNSLQIVTLTSPQSNHSKNIERNPEVAINITNTMQHPSSKKSGLELIGKMRRASGLEATKAYACYIKHVMLFSKKKLKASDRGASPGISKMMTSRPYIVDVELIKLYDEKALPPNTVCVAKVER